MRDTDGKFDRPDPRVNLWETPILKIEGNMLRFETDLSDISCQHKSTPFADREMGTRDDDLYTDPTYPAGSVVLIRELTNDFDHETKRHRNFL